MSGDLKGGVNINYKRLILVSIHTKRATEIAFSRQIIVHIKQGALSFWTAQ
jgi:hypothetical protein